MKNHITLLFACIIVFICHSCKQQNSAENKELFERIKDLTSQELLKKDTLGRSYLHMAAIEDDTSSINYLYHKKLDIDQKDDSGYTPLHVAVKSRSHASVKMLLDYNADIHVNLPDSSSIIEFAIIHNDGLSAELLYLSKNQKNYEIENGNVNYKLSTEAIKRKYYSMAELIIWPMHYIVKRDKASYFNHLISSNKNLLISRDEKKMTPLHIAYLYQNGRFIELLRSAGAVDAIDAYGKKPEEYRFENFTEMTSWNTLDDQTRAKLDDKIFDFLIHHNWITLGVIEDGKLAYLRSYGSGNMIDKDAVHASVSKPMTSIIFLQLLRKGLFRSLDDPIIQYSKKYRDIMPKAYVRDTITFRHILTHTSGIPHNDKPLWTGNKLNLQFSPGTQVSYSTPAFCVLGEIMEEVTGKSFSDLVKEYIGQPVNAASFWAEDNFRAPAARIHSTTRDFAKFAEAVINQKYLTESEFYDTLIGKSPGESLGWGSAGIGTDDIMVGHSGSNGKPRSHFLIKPRKKIAIVLMGETKDAGSDTWFLYLAPILMDIIDGKGMY